jgi:hypothetical protein
MVHRDAPYNDDAAKASRETMGSAHPTPYPNRTGILSADAAADNDSNPMIGRGVADLT